MLTKGVPQVGHRVQRRPFRLTPFLAQAILVQANLVQYILAQKFLAQGSNTFFFLSCLPKQSSWLLQCVSKKQFMMLITTGPFQQARKHSFFISFGKLGTCILLSLEPDFVPGKRYQTYVPESGPKNSRTQMLHTVCNISFRPKTGPEVGTHLQSHVPFESL